MTRTVVGHPRIISENFDGISTYFGLVKCTMLPPRGLFHPVLPYRTQGKLMFALCKTCADACSQTLCDRERAIQGTWCSVELEKALEKALEKGYQIVQIHEVWHFPETSDDLFKDYIDTFLKIKQEASGYPKDCVTKEQRQHYVDEYLEKLGIHLDPQKIEYNPGLRALAKLMLNSFWGKFAQQPNMVKTEQIKDPQVFFDYLTSDEIYVLDANLVSDDIIEIRYEYTDNFIKPDAKTNVVIAAFTTAYACLKLYGVLDMLHERVMYYDTDSVIFVSKLNEPEPPLGNHLGELTDELGGEYITVFASGGPKNYCYRTNSGKVETKVRGITLDCTARQNVNFEVIRGLVYLHAKCQVTGQVSVDIPFRITRNTRTKEIETKRMKKDHRIVYNKCVIMDDYRTLPYGVYSDPKRSGGSGGVDRLYQDVKDEGKFKISRKEIKEWLMKQDAYRLHKPMHRHFKRNRVIVGGIDQQWQMDLADMQSMQKFNDGYRYLLVCIDVFSKYAWVVPLKNKTGPTLVKAFKVILTSGCRPEKIMTNQGTEFLNKHF
ncbi:DNA polymerase [Paramuricea clavata]|uniref:DNA-directed DNA polymerase n=1 Tax=Paramuricea clavata TaxID=317549 RepID=A0A6S7GNI1_PARCT|nr:DNA polymerase [Paramuricea clavata]